MKTATDIFVEYNSALDKLGSLYEELYREVALSDFPAEAILLINKGCEQMKKDICTKYRQLLAGKETA